MAGYGVGASLMSLGTAQKNDAFEGMARAAEQESQRNDANKRLDEERKAGNKQLGSTLGSAAGMAIGAQYGSAAGPWGALLGGLVGAVAGGLF